MIPEYQKFPNLLYCLVFGFTQSTIEIWMISTDITTFWGPGPVRLSPLCLTPHCSCLSRNKSPTEKTHGQIFWAKQRDENKSVDQRENKNLGVMLRLCWPSTQPKVLVPKKHGPQRLIWIFPEEHHRNILKLQRYSRMCQQHAPERVLEPDGFSHWIGFRTTCYMTLSV